MEDSVDRQSLYMDLFGYTTEEEEEAEEEAGLPIPPMEDEDFLSSLMMNSSSNNMVDTDLADFFDQGAKRRSARPPAGKGKQLKLLREVLLAAPTNHQDDEQDQFSEAKIEVAKRKLHDGYEKVADVKRQKRIQIVQFPQCQKKQGCSSSAAKKNRGKTVKSRIESTFRQLKKLHTAQRPRMTAAY